MTAKGDVINLPGLKCTQCGFDGPTVRAGDPMPRDIPQEGDFLTCPFCFTQHKVVADGLQPVPRRK